MVISPLVTYIVKDFVTLKEAERIPFLRDMPDDPPERVIDFTRQNSTGCSRIMTEVKVECCFKKSNSWSRNVV